MTEHDAVIVGFEAREIDRSTQRTQDDCEQPDARLLYHRSTHVDRCELVEQNR